ncbi:MAG: type II toxin-antitoxin system YafQ family toxin [Acidobacteriaceae bacterium]|jgi:mRNA interferase YafQ|nr:type II toxin-antitoxin system YafQ family toxin [Acidobacteriaceae bacterium]
MLTGDWKDHRDCHVKPDLVLIYQKIGADTLRLVRPGSHAELGW